MNHDKKRKYIARLASKGAAIKPAEKPMCSTCAFKLDSDANKEQQAVDDAFACLALYGIFNCHHREGECSGFTMAKTLIEALDKAMEENL
jgi:adenine-specific DNA glycosylase